MNKVLIKDPSTMTLEKFIRLFDKEGCIVLLEGKRVLVKNIKSIF